MAGEKFFPDPKTATWRKTSACSAVFCALEHGRGSGSRHSATAGPQWICRQGAM